MRIFIDIGHPAHVHYFRNIIKEMVAKGHEFCVTARDKEVTHRLLEFYQIEYKSRGTGRSTLFGKTAYLLFTDFKLLKFAKSWDPDLFVSFGSPYASHVARIMNRPHIALTDTEHAKLGILSYAPFSKTIVTPKSFWKSFSQKQIRFDGFFELCYLHPKYFEHDISVRSQLGLKREEKFVLFRFVSWKASHDIGQRGISDARKIELVNLFLSNSYKVFISSEGHLLPELEKFKIVIKPERIHYVLKEADLYIGEGATMASEAALLGTPSVYVNTLDAGVFHEEMRYGLIYCLRNDNKLRSLVENLLGDTRLKEKHALNIHRMLTEKIDVTAFLIWLLENYPESHNKLRDNSSLQYSFGSCFI